MLVIDVVKKQKISNIYILTVEKGVQQFQKITKVWKSTSLDQTSERMNYLKGDSKSPY